MKKVDFVFFDAGGGHRAAATALKAVVEQRGLPWQIRLINLQDVLDDLDMFRKLTGIRMQDVYNLFLKKGWTIGSPTGVVAMHWLIRRYHPAQVKMLVEFWKQQQPDLVVSVIPNFGRALYESLHQVWPKAKLVTILTDIADYPPNFWMVPGQDQYYICGSRKAREQALALGYSEDRAIPVSGMILHPRFYEDRQLDRVAERKKLGLQPDLPTGLVLFGGQGSPVIRQILERVESASLPTQFIAICGKNESVRSELAARRWKMPVFAEGFTTEVPYYMALSDYFIGKPGPGSICEALSMRLPVIVERNAWTLPQERYNCEWVSENEVGYVLSNFRTVSSAVRQLLEGDTLEKLKARAGRMNNQAVFEIPPILEGLMDR